MAHAAHKQADGTFAMVSVVEVKRGWTTIVDAAGETRKVRNAELADWDDSLVESVLTDDEEQDAPRTGNVFPRHIRERYTKGKAANGKAFIDSGDELALALRGMELSEVCEHAARVLGFTPGYWLGFYTTEREAAGKPALNAGMVRMNLGNRIRAALAKAATEAAEFSVPEGSSDTDSTEEAAA